MNEATLLMKMSQLVKDGRVKPVEIENMLEVSGVELVCGGVCGVYKDGMLKVNGGLQTLDPNGITGFRMPPAAPPTKKVKVTQKLDLGQKGKA